MSPRTSVFEIRVPPGCSALSCQRLAASRSSRHALCLLLFALRAPAPPRNNLHNRATSRLTAVSASTAVASDRMTEALYKRVTRIPSAHRLIGTSRTMPPASEPPPADRRRCARVCVDWAVRDQALLAGFSRMARMTSNSAVLPVFGASSGSQTTIAMGSPILI